MTNELILQQDSPLFSVIIPVYNGERTVEAAVRSALRQSISSLEVLLLDDGSTDTTLSILRRLQREDSRVQVLPNAKNSGTAWTRNRGISLAKGKYIAFLDADDIWVFDKLERQYTLLQKTGADLCYTSYELMDAVGTRLGKTYWVPESTDYQSLLAENVIGCSTCVVRADSLEGFGMDERFFHEDFALWLQLLRNGKKAVGITIPLVYYRIGGKNGNKLQAAKNRWRIYREGENLDFWNSVGYFARYTVNGLKKYH